MKKILFILVISMLTLASCNKAPAPTPAPEAPATPEVQTPAPAPAPATPAATEIPAVDPYADLGPEALSKDGYYTVRIPTGFIADTTDPDYDMFYSNDEKHMAFFTMTLDKKDAKVASANEFLDTIKSEFKGLSMVSLTDTIKNSHDYTVLDRKYSGKFEDADMVVYTRALDFNNVYVLIVAMTIPEDIEANGPVLFDIIDSYKEKE